MAISDSVPPPSSDTCPECNGRVRPDDTERVCVECGLVITVDALDRGPDWGWPDSNKDSEYDPRRAAPPNRNYADRGLGSEVGYASERDRDDHRRSMRQHRAAAGSKADRNRSYATTEIQRMASALEVGDSIAAQAKRLFRDAHNGGHAHGRDLDCLAATCLYTTLRVSQRGMTPSDVADVARTDAGWIARRHTWLTDVLDVPTPPPDPEARLRRVAAACDVPHAGIERAVERLRGMDDCDKYAGSPSTLAAALLWDTIEGVAQNRVADAAGVSPTGVRQRLAAIR